MGRFVIFWSDQLLHEVLPCQNRGRHRPSLLPWLTLSAGIGEPAPTQIGGSRHPHQFAGATHGPSPDNPASATQSAAARCSGRQGEQLASRRCLARHCAAGCPGARQWKNARPQLGNEVMIDQQKIQIEPIIEDGCTLTRASVEGVRQTDRSRGERFDAATIRPPRQQRATRTPRAAATTTVPSADLTHRSGERCC